MNLEVVRDPPGTGVMDETSGFELESSTNGTNALLAGVFGNDAADLPLPDLANPVFAFGMAEGGGITVAVGVLDPSSASESLKTVKPPSIPDFEPEDPDPDAIAEDEEATRLLFPACFNVVPTIFFVSGMFSFTLVFLVPRSCHVSDDGSESSVREGVEPVGSTYIRSLDELEVDEVDMGIETLRRVCPAVEVEGATEEEEEEEEEEEDLREVVVSAARGFWDEMLDRGGAGGSIILLIIRFLKSLYRSCKCSDETARRAIPRLYASSAS